MLPWKVVSDVPLISFEKPKFVPLAEKACPGLSPCEERNALHSLDIIGIGNRPGPLMNQDPKFTEHERLDSAYNTDNIIYICEP